MLPLYRLVGRLGRLTRQLPSTPPQDQDKPVTANTPNPYDPLSLPVGPIDDAPPLPRGSSAWQKLRARILERDNHTCHYCGRPATHVDHVTPRSLLPTAEVDDPGNLVAACRACNLAKGNRPARPATAPKIREGWKP